MINFVYYSSAMEFKSILQRASTMPYYYIILLLYHCSLGSNRRCLWKFYWCVWPAKF